MFQYRGEDGVRFVTASDVNAFLREIAGVKISLKDSRTLCASRPALEALAHMCAGDSERGRRRQMKKPSRPCRRSFANTPTICRKSYVHQTVVAAFENGKLDEVFRDPEAAPFAGASRAIAGAGRGNHGGLSQLRLCGGAPVSKRKFSGSAAHTRCRHWSRAG
jgi:hypothetical protein